MQEKSTLEKTKSLFIHKPKPSSDLSQFLAKINDLSRRLKIIEERYTGLRRKTQLTEQNMLNINKKISTEVKTISSDINETRRALLEITVKIKEIKEELSKYAKKNDLKLLDKYMSYWEPLNYVTAEEVEKIAKEMLAKK